MEAFFLDGAEGPLFSIYHPACARCRQGIGLVYLPPFAEEMNRSRRMVALQARRLAACGIDVLLVDPYGTGDSAGDFADARWDIWREDAKAAVLWLRARCGGSIGLWGLRLGALLAAEVAADLPSPPARVVLWQPVLSGDRFLTQFLRLRVAAGMARGEKETAKDLRARLMRSEALEVAGYELAPDLAEAIAGRQLAGMLARLGEARVDVLEVGAAGDAALTPATRQLLDALGEGKLCCDGHAVRGEPFWSLQEITVAPELLDATEALFHT